MNLLSVSINVLSFVCAIGIIQGFFLAIILYFYRKGDHSVNRFLSFFIACSSIVMSGPLLIKFIGWKNSFIVGPFPLLSGPFLYFYVKSFKERVDWKKVLPHCSFFFIYVIVTFIWIKYLGNKYPNSPDFPKEGIYSPIAIIFFSIRYLHLIVYYFLAKRELRSYQNSIRHVFSETSRINLDWVNWILTWYISIVLSSVVIYVFMAKYPEYFYWLYLLNIAMNTVCIYLATFKGLSQPTIWQIQPNIETIHSYSPVTSITKVGKGIVISKQISVALDTRSEEIISRITCAMERDKLFQETELTLQNLADKLKYPSYQVSQVINDKMGKSFYELVNGYRVEEAKRLLIHEQSKNYTILSVGFEAGFNSKTTFNTVFKKFTGQTPTDYRNKALAC